MFPSEAGCSATQKTHTHTQPLAHQLQGPTSVQAGPGGGNSTDDASSREEREVPLTQTPATDLSPTTDPKQKFLFETFSDCGSQRLLVPGRKMTHSIYFTSVKEIITLLR